MAYKLVKDGKTVDILTNLQWVKWNERHSKPYLTEQKDAEGILSSDRKNVYAVYGMKENPKHVFEHVDELVEITDAEYNAIKALNGKSAQEIIDAYTLSLIESGVIS